MQSYLHTYTLLMYFPKYQWFTKIITYTLPTLYLHTTYTLSTHFLHFTYTFRVNKCIYTCFLRHQYALVNGCIKSNGEIL